MKCASCVCVLQSTISCEIIKPFIYALCTYLPHLKASGGHYYCGLHYAWGYLTKGEVASSDDSVGELPPISDSQQSISSEDASRCFTGKDSCDSSIRPFGSSAATCCCCCCLAPSPSPVFQRRKFRGSGDGGPTGDCWAGEVRGSELVVAIRPWQESMSR